MVFRAVVSGNLFLIPCKRHSIVNFHTCRCFFVASDNEKRFEFTALCFYVFFHNSKMKRQILEISAVDLSSPTFNAYSYGTKGYGS